MPNNVHSGGKTRSYVFVAVMTVLSYMNGNALGQTTDTISGEIADRLTGRRAALSEGSVSYESYLCAVSQGDYEAFREKVLGKDQGSMATDARELANRFAVLPEVQGINKYEGSMFYRYGERDKWRLVRRRIGIASEESRRLETEAAKNKQVVVRSPDREDVAYNGEYVMSLRDDAELNLDRENTAIDYPRIEELDISLFPWYYLRQRGANPGQTISGKIEGTTATITYANQRKDGSRSAVSYEYRMDLGYAPSRVWGESDGKLFMERLYAYGDADPNGNGLNTPILCCQADFKPGGWVRVQLWVVKKWIQQVSDDDLNVKLPEKYIVVDNRYGNVPLFVERDTRQEEHISELPFEVKQWATTASTQAATKSVSDLQQASVKWTSQNKSTDMASRSGSSGYVTTWNWRIWVGLASCLVIGVGLVIRRKVGRKGRRPKCSIASEMEDGREK